MSYGSLTSVLVTPYGAENPKSGGGQRTNLLFQALNELGPVHVIYLGDSTSDGTSIFFPGAEGFYPVHSVKFGRTDRRNLLAFWTQRILKFLSVSNYYGVDPEASLAVRSIVGGVSPDVVVIRYFHTASVSDLLNANAAPVFLDIDDRDDQKFETMGRNWLGSGLLYRSYKALFVDKVRDLLMRGVSNTSHVWVANKEDRDNLAEIGSVSILPNVPFIDEVPTVQQLREASRVVYVASEGHTPNREAALWFLREVWPQVISAVPDAQFDVVGIGAWEKTLAEFSDLPGLNVVGFVEDIVDGYSPAGIAISPVFDGGGTKIKVLEAMQFGLPVVATDHSLRGFSQEVIDVAFAASSSAQFAAHLITLLREPELRQSRGIAGQNAVRNTYTKSAFFDEIRRSIVERLDYG